MKELEDEVTELKDLVKKMSTGTSDYGKVQYQKRGVREIGVNTHMEGSTKYLSVYFRIKTRPIPDSWSATVFKTTKIINHSHKEKSHSSHESEITYNAANPAYGLAKYMTFTTLSNAANGYIKDDSILVEVHFTIYPNQ
ncbi:hypothetical protein PRIPAC_85845 [Pristionchus pacificus]|uniref:MATH domain-containing protein n=1 Tax=Pristionchus pacificus TaxID=54126 RepID=A0A8R1UBS0_PRIPA|nr:hypothetical protein PRIPAC_85845 [Pristionchus pacificus]|eukprot:PDM66956.1 hypothetical protein PRIPAC_48373 [Pristionchus pacificus]